MKKSTLYVIADILNTIEHSNRNLYELLDMMNITPEEKEKILDSIYVITEKLEQVKRSNINSLDEHVDIEQIERISRF
jgi:hypothetical protein